MGKLLDSLLGGNTLNYVYHRICIRREIAGARKERKHVKLVDMDIQKELAGGK